MLYSPDRTLTERPVVTHNLNIAEYLSDLILLLGVNVLEHELHLNLGVFEFDLPHFWVVVFWQFGHVIFLFF